MATSKPEANDPLGRHGIMLPSEPAVLQELQSLVDDANSDVKQMAGVIVRDPGLTARLFRLARSPAYCRGRTLDTVEQVLLVVGVEQTFNLVRALSIQQVLPGDPKTLDTFWSRSHAIAELAAVIAAERVAICNVFPDQAYLAAVFLDCGVPILSEKFKGYWTHLGLDDPSRWVSVKRENERFDLDHCVVGYLVARHWGLPDFICSAIRSHHELPETSDTVRSLIAILQLATKLYLDRSGLACFDWSRYRTEWLEELGVHGDDLAEYADEIEERRLAANA